MSEPKDIFIPTLDRELGSIHPINQVKFELIKLLTSFGFEVAEGPEIESEKNNFDMLNIPATHPAREMHDTFYVGGKKNVLRTHTSPVQVRCMLRNKPPISFISPGKVYRKDDDSTHLPMFHQVLIGQSSSANRPLIECYYVLASRVRTPIFRRMSNHLAEVILRNQGLLPLGHLRLAAQYHSR